MLQYSHPKSHMVIAGRHGSVEQSRYNVHLRVPSSAARLCGIEFDQDKLWFTNRHGVAQQSTAEHSLERHRARLRGGAVIRIENVFMVLARRPSRVRVSFTQEDEGIHGRQG